MGEEERGRREKDGETKNFTVGTSVKSKCKRKGRWRK